MVLINYATKEIVAKIVYYGPGLCGKTTNLQQVFTKLNPKKRGKMISLATEADRTLFFDFLPMELGMVQGFKVRFQLYTVPGQVFYGATRKLVLKGADAVVFVADSQKDVLGKNIESIEDMKQNLQENGLDPEVIPIVFQYNKRDLANVLDIDTLEREVNFRHSPYFAASAIEGTGVMETFKEITRLLLQYLKGKHSFMNTDKLKDLPAEIFEYKPVEVKPVEYELELGSAIRDEGPGEEVIAGELLDQIETISLADTEQAEAFFDVVRKGASTEEARQKAEMVVETPDADLAPADLTGEMEDFLAAPQDAPTPVHERELTPDELEIETPAPIPPPEREEYMGLDMTSPEMMEPDGAVFDMQAPEPLSVPISVLSAQAPPPPPPPYSPPPPQAVDIAPIVLALDRLERQVVALGGEIEDLKSVVSNTGPAPNMQAAAAPSIAPETAGRIDELAKGLKAGLEGQDRLLLSILESVRESKKSSADSLEKLDDALKYIIDKLRDVTKEEGKGQKKKWF